MVVKEKNEEKRTLIDIASIKTSPSNVLTEQHLALTDILKKFKPAIRRENYKENQ
jgi:hypothetical protein